MLAAIEVLAGLPAPRTLVLGDMGEVGAAGPEFHAEIGRHAAARGIDALLAIGPLCREAVNAAGARGTHFDDLAALVEAAQARATSGSLLVKGSRFMRMERVVQALAVPEA